MAYAYIKVSAAAGQTSVPFNFDYLSTSEIRVTINDVETTAWSLSSPNVISFSSPLSGGEIVQVERVTDLVNRAVDFSSGAVLTEEDLDLSAQQVFNAAQEALDSTEKNLTEDYTSNYNAYGKKITGVAKGVDPTDVINKAQLDYDYPAVKIVSDNMDDVNDVSNNMSDINRVQDSIDNIDRVHTSIDKVDRVHQSIAKVDRVYTSVDEIDRVHTSIGNVDRVYTSIANIDRVDESIEKVDRVYTSIDEIDRVYTSIGKIDTVEGDITRIDTVADNITDVNNVSDNMADINEVQDNLTAVNTVADNVTDVNTVADNITDVNVIAANLDDVKEIAAEFNLKITTQVGTLQDFQYGNGVYTFMLGPEQPEHSIVEVGDKLTIATVAQEFKVISVYTTGQTVTTIDCVPTGTNTSSLSAITAAFNNNAAVYMDVSAIEAVAAIKEEVLAVDANRSAIAGVYRNENKINTVNDNISAVNTISSNITKIDTVYTAVPDITVINDKLANEETYLSLGKVNLVSSGLPDVGGNYITHITNIKFAYDPRIVEFVQVGKRFTNSRVAGGYTLSDVEYEITNVNYATPQLGISVEVSPINLPTQTEAEAQQSWASMWVEWGTAPLDYTLYVSANTIDAVAVNNDSIDTVAEIADDVTAVADDISIIQDAADTLDGFNSVLVQMATSFTEAQTRYVEAHAFE